MLKVLLAVICSASALAAQSGWMPEAAVEGIASEIAPRLDQSRLGIDAAKLLPAARIAVTEMRDRLDKFGDKRVISLAPKFPQLKIPLTGQPHLDAMAAYGMCTYYLEARFANPPKGADVDAKLNAAIGPLSLALTTMYLRHHYLAGGGTDAQIKEYLAGDPLNQVAFAVQKDPKLLDYTAAQCRAAVSALLD